MNDQSEGNPKVRGAIALGWFLLIPIGMLWWTYRNGVVIGSYSNHPAKSGFTFLPLMFLVALTGLLYFVARKELPNAPYAKFFFWIACTPIIAEFIAATLS